MCAKDMALANLILWHLRGRAKMFHCHVSPKGICLVVFTILKNMIVYGKDDIPYIVENKTCLKPPTRYRKGRSLAQLTLLYIAIWSGQVGPAHIFIGRSLFGERIGSGPIPGMA
jgi:hypothetical protein